MTFSGLIDYQFALTSPPPGECLEVFFLTPCISFTFMGILGLDYLM